MYSLILSSNKIKNCVNDEKMHIFSQKGLIRSPLTNFLTQNLKPSLTFEELKITVVLKCWPIIKQILKINLPEDI